MKFLVIFTILMGFVLEANSETTPLVKTRPLVVSPKNKESYKDIIQKAQNLTLQQDRLQASQVLVRVIKTESYNKKAQEELKKTLNDISTVFYTEKAQKTFEYGKSLLRESSLEALDKFKEAIKLEPDNILILLWSARLSLFLGKCEEADQSALKGLEVNPFYPQLQLIELQAKACTQNIEALNKAVSENKHLQELYPLYYNLVLAQKFYVQKQYPEALYHIERAKQIDKEFAEIYFWETQILEKQEFPVKESASRYIRNCKTVSNADYLKYRIGAKALPSV